MNARVKGERLLKPQEKAILGRDRLEEIPDTLKNAAALGDDAIEEQMELARVLSRNGRCIPGPDRMELENVTFEEYKKFMRRLREAIMTTKPGQYRRIKQS